MSFNYYRGKWDKKYLYKEASDYLKKYSDIQRAKELKTKLNKDYVIYRDEIEEFLNRAVPEIESCQKEHFKMSDKEEIFKRLGIVFIILFLVCAIIGRYIPFQLLFSIFEILVLISGLVAGVGIIYCKMKGKALAKKQSSVMTKFENEAMHINARTQWIKGIYKEIDTLYLATLDPAHREAVLMRRDQERHHREMMNAQQEHNQAMVEEQRKILQTQEEILQIEREREERYRRNSY